MPARWAPGRQSPRAGRIPFGVCFSGGDPQPVEQTLSTAPSAGGQLRLFRLSLGHGGGVETGFGSFQDSRNRISSLLSGRRCPTLPFAATEPPMPPSFQALVQIAIQRGESPGSCRILSEAKMELVRSGSPCPLRPRDPGPGKSWNAVENGGVDRPIHTGDISGLRLLLRFQDGSGVGGSGLAPTVAGEDAVDISQIERLPVVGHNASGRNFPVPGPIPSAPCDSCRE